jgi:hypothetical protein
VPLVLLLLSDWCVPLFFPGPITWFARERIKVLWTAKKAFLFHFALEFPKFFLLRTLSNFRQSDYHQSKSAPMEMHSRAKKDARVNKHPHYSPVGREDIILSP